MDYFTKWPEAYAIPDQEASTVADVLVPNYFCCFGIPRELHSDQGRNFESRLLQAILQRLGVSKTRTTPLHPQSDGIVELYIKTAEEHLRKVVASNQNAMLPLFLLANRASTHDTTGVTPASLLFGRELRLPSELLFGTLPDKERPTIEHAANLVDHLRDIHNYALQHLRLASSRMKIRYDKLAKCAGGHPSFNPLGRAHTR
jgi:transposase InsO family protein